MRTALLLAQKMHLLFLQTGLDQQEGDLDREELTGNMSNRSSDGEKIELELSELLIEADSDLENN